MADASHQEILDRLRLARTANVGPVNYRLLLERYGHAGAALAAIPELARRGGSGSAPRIPTRQDAGRELEEAERLGARIAILGLPGYPALLAEIPDAPPVFYRRGRDELLERPALALVGARDASANGQRFAEKLARDAGGHGIAVVSGLARGIDAAAHWGSLETGTIAVIAGGIDVVYPPEHGRLQAEIAERGLLLAEMPPGIKPQARHFPRRNRIISGLSLGILVVEAALRSGSLITARLAAEQGREVMAVPGSPLDARCRGTNGLIREGAALIEGIEDVLEAVPALSGSMTPRAMPGLGDGADRSAARLDPGESIDGSTRDLLAGLLGPSPVPVDELMRRCHLSSAVLHGALLEMELAGRLERLPGNRVALLVDM